MPAEKFEFHPPEGSTEVSDPAVYHVGGAVSAPVVLSQVEPEYTKEAEAAGVEGKVVMYVEITPQGTASHIKIRQMLGMGLDEQAVQCVKQWRFRPGMKNGEPVTVAATIEVNFMLNHKKQP